MKLSFNTEGYLHETVELSFEQFKQHFGTNAHRIELIKAAIKFFKIFSSCGCKAVYVDGSFVSKKNYPEDIDLLFDFNEVDDEKLKEKFPEFFDKDRHNLLGRIRRDSKCHIFTLEKGDQEMFDFLQWDRKGY